MAGRNADIKVTVKGDADFGAARREAKDALDDIEKKAKDVKLSPELDTADIRKAIALAEQLDGMVATLDIDADPADIVQAEKLARSLRGFQARVDLSVEGKAELTEALGLADKMEGLRKVRVEVQGRQDLERAQEIADDLEKRRTVQVDVDDSELSRAGDKLEASLDDAGESGANAIGEHLGDIDFESIGASGVDQLTGALAAAGPWGAAAAAAAAVFADDFLAGFQDHFGKSKADLLRSLKFNLSPSEMADIGEAAGNLYMTGLSGELSRGELRDAVAQIKAELGSVDDDLDLERVTGQALALEQVFGTDLADSIATVDKLVSLRLVPNAEAGFNAVFALGQQTGDQFDEALDVATEFSAALASIGIEGPQGLYLIGQAIEKGIFPQVDQAGEVFEEFNEIIRTGGAAEALDEIGLSAEEMQGFLADGRGAEAMSLIAGILLSLPDPTRRAALAAEIFGGNMALVADPDIALQLFAQADGVREVGTAATDSSAKLADARTNLEGFQKGAEDAGSAMADGLNSALGVVSEGLVDWVDKMTGGAVSASALAKAVGEGPPKMAELADGAAELAGEMVGATQSVDELEAELRGLFDFSADQLLRDIADAGDALAESFDKGAASTVGLNGEIDISTEAGRRLQAQMEDLNGSLVDAAVAFANGEISADQFAQIQDAVTSQLDRTAGKADLTSGKVQGLTDKYNDQAAIDSITTDLIANDLATPKITALQRALAALPTTKSITVTTINQSIGASGTVKTKARGGWTDGLTLVGEEGPELIDVRGRAFVHTAAETRELMSNRGGALSGSPAAPAGRGGAFIGNATIVVDKGVDLWQALDMAELVYGGRR